mgnify:CR=1 FL=1
MIILELNLVMNEFWRGEKREKVYPSNTCQFIFRLYLYTRKMDSKKRSIYFRRFTFSYTVLQLRSRKIALLS